MRRAVVVIALLATIPASAGAAPDTPLSLEKAVSEAVAHNRELANARLEAEKAHDRYLSVLRSRYPAFTVTAIGGQSLTDTEFEFRKGIFGTYDGIGPVPSEDTRIEIAPDFNVIGFARMTQPISQLYDINLGARMAAVEESIQKERVREAELALNAEVKRLYYSIQQSESALNAVSKSVELLEELQRQVDIYVTQQVALKADALETAARLASAKQTQLILRNAIASQSEGLNRLLGRDPVSPLTLAPLSAEPDIALTSTGSARPDVRAAELRETQALHDLRLARADYLPDVSLLGTWITPSNFDLIPKNFATLGVLVQWQPFDWGGRRMKVSEKARTLQQAQNAATEARLAAENEVRIKRRLLAEAAALVRVREAQQAAAEERFRIATEKFKAEAALMKDVLASEAEAAQASHQLQEAALALFSARAELEKATGESR